MRAEKPTCDALIELFNASFQASEGTVLVGGGEEPIYLPADAQFPFHRVIFREDFVASALHEIAHWCIAGAERRQLVDFGYWYCPDGRDAWQQNQFESVEALPQSLEWIFNAACGMRFRPSIDNLGGEQTDPALFHQAIMDALDRWFDRGIPERAMCFIRALSERWGDGTIPQRADFRLDSIDASG